MLDLKTDFYTADVTKNIITPVLGNSSIGFVMACFGTTDFIATLLIGTLSDRGLLMPLFTIGILFQIFVYIFYMIIVFIFSDLDLLREFPMFIYITAAFFGIGDAAFLTGANVVISKWWTENPEPAFAQLQLFQSIGFIITFGWGPIFSFELKLILSLIFSAFVLISLVLANKFVHRIDSKQTKSNPPTLNSN